MRSKNIILIFVISLLIVTQLSLIFINKGLWWDEAVYLGLAENLRNGVYSLSSSRSIESFRAPLFPLISSILGANSKNILFSRLIPWTFYLLSILSIYKVGEEFFSSKEAGLVSSLILGSFPLLVFYSGKFLTESLFVFLFTLSLYFFSKMLNSGDKKYVILFGIFTGLSFLTRYVGIVILPVFFLWLIFRKEFKNAILLLVGFALPLSPWFIFNYLKFGNPLWSFLSNLKVYSTMIEKPIFYYFSNSYQIFGPLIIVIVIGYLYSVKDFIFGKLTEREKLILFLSIVIPLIFTILGNKNTRYLVAFYPVFSLLTVIFIEKVKKYGSKVQPLILFFVIILSLGSFYLGYNRSIRDIDSGKALKNAAIFLGKNTNHNEKILTQIYFQDYPEWNFTSFNPWLRVIPDRNPIPFPKDKRDLERTLRKENIEYVLIYNFEPRVPEYSKEIENEKFSKVETFEQWNNEEAAVIYKYID